jgi:hypothetical protein
MFNFIKSLFGLISKSKTTLEIDFDKYFKYKFKLYGQLLFETIREDDTTFDNSLKSEIYIFLHFEICNFLSFHKKEILEESKEAMFRIIFESIPKIEHDVFKDLFNNRILLYQNLIKETKNGKSQFGEYALSCYSLWTNFPLNTENLHDQLKYSSLTSKNFSIFVPNLMNVISMLEKELKKELR